VSSIDPIRPVAGPPRLQPLKRREREAEEGHEEPREEPRDEPESGQDEGPRLIDIRA
jgi:hypothetical protein